MSTDHYAEAVSSIDNGNNTSLADPACAYYIQRAQVHATLALVDAVRALAERQVQIDVKDEGSFQLRGIAVRRPGGVA